MIARKVGPLSIGAWALAIAAGLVVVYLYRRRQAAAQTPAAVAGGAAGAAPFAPPAGYTGTATGMLPGPLDANGQPIGFHTPAPLIHGGGLQSELAMLQQLVGAFGSLAPPPAHHHHRGRH